MSRPTCCHGACEPGRTCPNRMTSQHLLRTICCGAAFCYAVAFIGKALISVIG